jgi:hypothetical protein
MCIQIIGKLLPDNISVFIFLLHLLPLNCIQCAKLIYLYE